MKSGPGKWILLTALVAWMGMATTRAADEVNLSLVAHQAIPTASDAIDGIPRQGAYRGAYSHQAGAFADGKQETAWITGRDTRKHWARIVWRNVTVSIQRVEIDFAPVAFSHRLHTESGQSHATSPIPRTSMLPEQFSLEVHTQGHWRTVHALQDSIRWANGTRAEIVFDAPLTQVTELVLRLNTETADHFIAVREIAAMGPATPTSFPFRPKWDGIWLWGDPKPRLPNFGLIRRYLRRVFTLGDPGAIRAARIQFVAHDRGEVFLNGVRIARTVQGGRGMKPIYASEAVDPKLLRKGKNVLAIIGEDTEDVGLHCVLAQLSFQSAGVPIPPVATDKFFRTATCEEDGWLTSTESFDHWEPAKLIGSPNKVHVNARRQPFTPPFPIGTIRIETVSVHPDIPRPGQAFELTVTVELPTALPADFGLIVDYGETAPSLASHFDYTLGESFITPKNALPKGFVGRKTLRLQHVWPKGTPPRVPLYLRFCNKNDQLAPLPGTVGKVTQGDAPHRLKVYVGQAPVEPRKKGFPDVRITAEGILTVNGQPTAPIAFTSSCQTIDRLQTGLSSGVKLFRFSPLQRASLVADDGEEETLHRQLLRSLEIQVETMRAMDREAKALIMISVDMPNSWKIRHPEELMVLGNNTRLIPLTPTNRTLGYMQESPSSVAVQRKVYLATRNFVARMAKRPWAESIIGFTFHQGRAGENYWGLNANMSKDDDGKWIIPDRNTYFIGDYGVAARRSLEHWLKEKYGTKEKLATAWRVENLDFADVTDAGKWSQEKILERLMWRKRPNGRFVFRDRIEAGAFFHDFVRHQSEARLHLLEAAGRGLKEASGGNLLSGAYIGYILPSMTNSPPGAWQHSGHASFDAVLASPYIDCLFSPHFYHMRRKGDPVMPMSAADSLRLAGKLWINEYDSRTYLSPIGPKTFSQRETLEVFQKEFGAAITRGQGWWWLEFPFALVGDMAASWFDDPLLLRQAGVMKRIYERRLALPGHEPSSEIAVIVSAKQGFHTDVYSPANTIHSNIVNRMIPNMFKAGAPIDIYDISSLPRLVERGWHRRYKLFYFVNAFHLTAAERTLIDTHLKRDGRTLSFFFAPGYQGNAGAESERSLAGIEAVTGMRGVRKIDELHLLGLRLKRGRPLPDECADTTFEARGWSSQEQLENYGNSIGPVFYLDPAEANGWQTLATLRLDEKDAPGKVAVAMLSEKSHRVIYSVLPDVPVALLTAIAKSAGVHCYTPPGVLAWADARFLCVHTGPARESVTLTARRNVTWIEPFERKIYARDTNRITIDLEEGETKFFCLQQTDEWAEFLKDQ